MCHDVRCCLGDGAEQSREDWVRQQSGYSLTRDGSERSCQLFLYRGYGGIGFSIAFFDNKRSCEAIRNVLEFRGVKIASHRGDFLRRQCIGFDRTSGGVLDLFHQFAQPSDPTRCAELLDTPPSCLRRPGARHVDDDGLEPG
jgi:hypothetical protein